ncbi:ribonuclease P protein component [Mycolicibacterium litorale]|uniref:ribonuclease P protein component n=1 Tax=Mycolicibacterium litorale TaxID=758802 RepID=UPI003CEE221A
MLPARYRMTRSTEFSTTVSKGVRSAQPDLVVHIANDGGDPTGPRVGLVVSKAVGNAVVRHRVSRRLRHSVYPLLDELQPGHRLVIRALPGAAVATSARLAHELSEALRRARPRVKASA